VHSSAVTDRGLNERRPLNEDSFLADSQRGVFAVADGVGGSEAGEVASQTAVEVLDEAFRHQVDGADIEDLMELAIQRANASIHQMAQDHAKFSMMATTIVALHIEGNRATIGHVGDSRLYRLTPEGQLLRETDDHSVVEEEVRAGRMTPEQAANHPSKNVISRALGAENDVEVDMKIIDVEDGTQFLLCTDGITRHIPDYELRQLLIISEDLPAICEELKRRCYERGAEDNLTAVLVRVGNAIPTDQRLEELERTISPETDSLRATAPPAPLSLEMPKLATDGGIDAFIPPSRVAFPADSPTHLTGERTLEINAPRKGSFGRTIGRLFLLLLALGAVGAAFYAGRTYKGHVPFLPQTEATIPQVATPTPIVEEPFLKFERARREVDKNPAAWLSNQMTLLASQGVQNPLDSPDPEFLYLYGRASMLTGNHEQAARAFEAAIAKTSAAPTPENATLRREATAALAATALKVDQVRPQALTHFDEILQPPTSTTSP
jgi:protein phosphatase